MGVHIGVFYHCLCKVEHKESGIFFESVGDFMKLVTVDLLMAIFIVANNKQEIMILGP